MNYMREMTIGDILKSSFGIYFKHFGTLFSISFASLLIIIFSVGIVFLLFLAPSIAFPSSDAAQVLAVIGVIIAYFLYLFGLSLLPAASTVAISEITLGNKPSFTRAYKRVFGALLGKLFATSLLYSLILIVGLILLIIPGIYFMIKYILATTVVVLENIWGRDALKRGGELVKGYYGRVFGVYFLFFGALIIVYMMIYLISIITAGEAAGMFIYFIFIFIILPVGVIPIVLMYYDLRVRKEGYDTAALAEDLQH